MRALRPLGEEWIKLLHRATGLDIIHADAGREYVFTFVTADHRHGWFDVCAYDDARNAHYNFLAVARERVGGEEIPDDDPRPQWLRDRKVWALRDRCPRLATCERLFPVEPVRPDKLHDKNEESP